MSTEKKGKPSVPTTENTDKNNRIGLWVSMSAAAVAAVGVLAVAFYMDSGEHEPAAATETVQAASESSAPSSIPTSEGQAASMAAALSDQQSQGMTAPSDVGDENETASAAAASAASAVQPPAEGASAAASAPAAAASSPAAAILAHETAVHSAAKAESTSDGHVRFYFARGKADLAADTLEALKGVVEGVKTGKKAVILSHADAESNASLIKERASAVRSVLLAAGVPGSSIEIKEPASGNGDGRLVEVQLN